MKCLSQILQITFYKYVLVPCGLPFYFLVSFREQKFLCSWRQVAHTCNPWYSGGRGEEDQGSKPAQANSSMRPYLEKTLHKKGLMEWLKV
jgi:hypothetical protein